MTSHCVHQKQQSNQEDYPTSKLSENYTKHLIPKGKGVNVLIAIVVECDQILCDIIIQWSKQLHISIGSFPKNLNPKKII